MEFNAADLHDDLDRSGPEAWDDLPFGIVAMDKTGVVTGYNAFEAKMAGLSKETVLGHHFFVEVAPCANNNLVAERFVEENEIDDTIDYTFMVRMKARPVKLRLLKKTDRDTMYLAVEG